MNRSESRCRGEGTVIVGEERSPYVAGALSRTDFVRYQGASGDMHPIHHDDTFAREAGFPSVFAPGMYAAGVLAAYLTSWWGPKNIRRYMVQFREQAWPGDVLVYTLTVVAVRNHPTGDEIDIEAARRRQACNTHLDAWATFWLPGTTHENAPPTSVASA